MIGGELLFIIFILLLFLLWTLFGLIGFIACIDWLNKRITAQKQNNQSESYSESRQKKEQQVQGITATQENILIWIGAFLVIFAITIFIIFNWQQYTLITKATLICLFTTAFYFIGLLLYNNKRFKKIRDTFIFLGSVSLFFTGIGLWKFAFEAGVLNFLQYWSICSLVISGVYLLLYRVLKSKTYGWLTMLLYTYTFAAMFIKTPLANTFTDLLLVAAALLIPLYYTYKLRLSDKYQISSWFVGLSLPFSIYLIGWTGWTGTTDTPQIAIQLIIMIGSVLCGIFSKDRTLRHSLFKPLFISSLLLLSILPWYESRLVVEHDSTLLAITCLATAATITFVAYMTSRNWVRLLAVPYELVGYFAFILALEYGGFLQIKNAADIGLLILLPATTLMAEFSINSLNRSKVNLSAVSWVIFTLIAIFSSISDPGYMVITSLFLFIYSVVLLFATKKSLFIYLALVAASLIVWSYGINSNFELMQVLILQALVGTLFSMLTPKSDQSLSKFGMDRNHQCALANSGMATTTTLQIFAALEALKPDSSIIILISLLIVNLLILHRTLKYSKQLIGLSVIAFVWHIAQSLGDNIHLFSTPVAIYLIYISLQLRHHSSKLAQLIEAMAFTLPAYILLIQSAYEDEFLKIIYGLILLAISTCTVIIGLGTKRKMLALIGVAFLILELIIRLYVIIVLIPWWIYVGLLGLLLILAAVWVIIRTTRVASRE